MMAVFVVFREEFRRIFALRPAFSVLIAAVAIYAVFYPQPYLNETLRNVPLALVDLDGTTSSRELARRIDATPDVAIGMVLPDVPSAQRSVYERTISGILVIPRNFERDLLHGRPSPIALYADASYFLIYQRISLGVAAVARTFGTEIETARLIAFGIDPAVAAAAADPLIADGGAAVQSAGRLRDLYLAGGLRPDPATDAADRGRPARYVARRHPRRQPNRRRSNRYGLRQVARLSRAADRDPAGLSCRPSLPVWHTAARLDRAQSSSSRSPSSSRSERSG